MLSPNARPDVHLQSLSEHALADDPADQAGRLWLEAIDPIGGPDPAWRARPATGSPSVPGSTATSPPPKTAPRPTRTASSRQRFTLVFEVGAPGIAVGGSLFLMPDPFWFWSEVESQDPRAPGFTTARLRAPASGARLVPGEAPGSFRIEGRALRAGEQIELVYGAGTEGATVDRYAERGAPLRAGLDAQGDGRRAWLEEPALVDIVAGPPSELVAFGPAELGPGEDFELTLALVDRAGNRAPWPPQAANAPRPSDATRTAFVVESLPTASLAPARGLGDRSSVSEAEAPHRLPFVAPDEEGTLRLRIRGTGALAAFSADVPPIVVRRSDRRLVFADLHGHTAYSDGTGNPEDYFRYARDVARLDAVALTDHDHWGIDSLVERPDRQAEILARVAAYHEPGRFVTLPGYEWTSWLHGHRHVLSFDSTLAIHSSLDAATDRPDELWAALRGKPVLTFAHHSAGEPVATNWHFAPDPELEPVTEIASIHGMSEALDAPAPIASPVPGNFVRDVLRHGARLGFIGSSDSHDGHPGLAQIAAGQSGLAGLFVERLDREPLRRALRARHTFATNGIRPWLDVSLDGVAMGGTLAAGGNDHTLRLRYEATAPIARVDLIRSGHVAQIALEDGEESTDPPAPRLSLALERRVPRLGPGEFHYVRIVQRDGGVAWSSPIFADSQDEGGGEK